MATTNPTDSHFIEVASPQASRALVSKSPQFTLEWTNVTLKVTTKSNKAKSKTKEEKVIINGVNGSARPGQLLVMMGPSGAGKSSLLDCISGRKDARSGLEGTITVNGQPWTKQLRQQTSYVVQDDLFYETITVREHLLFQAQLRMGKKASLQECENRVLLFGGLIVNLDDTPVYFFRINYVSLKYFNFSSRSAWIDGVLLLVLNVAYRALRFVSLWVNVHGRK